MKQSYTVIQDWMLDKGLNPSELLCYATIFGFCQDGESLFAGSRNYLGRKMAVSSTRTVDAALLSLTEKNLIRKDPVVNNGVTFNRYAIMWDAVPGHESANTEDNATRQASVAKSDAFNFRTSLIDLGVEPSLAEQWLKVRKVKKMVNTEVAFAAIKREIEASGRPASECVRLAVEKSWGGFKAEWMLNNSSPRAYAKPNPAPAPRRGGVIASEEIVAAAMAEFNK